MSTSPVTEVFSRATRLALRAGVSEIDPDILLMAINFEKGAAEPVDLSELDALLARYAGARVDEPVAQSSGGQSFGGYYSSGWIGLSKEVQAVVASFGGFEAMTVDSLRAVLLAARNGGA